LFIENTSYRWASSPPDAVRLRALPDTVEGVLFRWSIIRRAGRHDWGAARGRAGEQAR
jgi:hypothetical protein